jgi:protoporphyrinogen oxidase
MSRVIVVGGGVVGLTMALRAAQDGRSVTLLEAAPTLGGLTSPWTIETGDESDGQTLTWDRFYHVTLASDHAWRSVLRELELDASMVWGSTRTGALSGGQMYPVSSPVELLKFKPMKPVDRVRLGASVLYASRVKDSGPLDNIAVEPWLRKISGDGAVDSFWLPQLRAKLGTAYPDASAAFIWATAQRLMRARKAGIGEEKFGYLPGGYARIVQRFEEVLRAKGVAIQTSAAVRSVSRSGVVSGAASVELSDGTVLEADEVVVTTSTNVASTMIDGLTDDEQSRLRAERYQGCLCVSLVLDRPLHEFYLTYLLDEQTSDAALTAIVDMSSLVSTEFGGRGLLYLPRYQAPDDPWFDRSDAEVSDAFVDSLCAVLPSFDRSRILGSRVARAREVFTVPTLGSASRVLPFATSVAGVSIVTGAQIVHGTLNVDESVTLAERASVDLFGVGAIPFGTVSSIARASSKSRPYASLSLDLDNEWAYLMTHGNPIWTEYPSYLPVVVPRVLSALSDLGETKITFFVVGLDATRPENHEPIAMLAKEGHDIANHSFRHQPWLHRYSIDELREEFDRSEDALERVTGIRTTGFRGPGYSLSAGVLQVLAERGYRYDASTLPTVIGPVSRAFYFRSAKLTEEQRAERSNLFGSWTDGLRPLRAYQWSVPSAGVAGARLELPEIPVTTLPGLRVPIHISYLLYLAAVNPKLASAYFASALRVCDARGVAPSILLHPLDFLGADDVSTLAFFPAMNMGGQRKTELVMGWLEQLRNRYEIVTMDGHLNRLLDDAKPLPVRNKDRYFS